MGRVIKRGKQGRQEPKFNCVTKSPAEISGQSPEEGRGGPKEGQGKNWGKEGAGGFERRDPKVLGDRGQLFSLWSMAGG